MTTDLMTKAPADVLDYDIDFDRWLSASDRITDASTALDDVTEGGTIAVDQTDHADRSVKIWLSGGRDQDSATVVVTITTVEGRTKEVRFRIRARESR